MEDAREPNRNYKVPHVANTIQEEFPRVGDAIRAIGVDVAALLTSVSQRALVVHDHTIAQVTGLQTALDSKHPNTWRPGLDEITDVNAPSPAAGQVLMRVGSQWQPANVTLDAAAIVSGVLDPARIPVLSSSQAPVVSSGLLADLTAPQQAEISVGRTVVTTDGKRWIYTVSGGDKTLSSSYIELADTTPEWNAIANKPSEIVNLVTLLAEKLGIADRTPTGVIQDYLGGTAPSGWVLLDGRTIGSASSGANNRANADTQPLYELIWNNLANAQAPVSGGRGASAAADFAANKTITLPDARGRARFGRDNMGGSAASRVTTAGSGVDGATLGASGGAQSHTLTAAEMPVHNHGGTTDTQGAHSHSGSTDTQGAHSHTVNPSGAQSEGASGIQTNATISPGSTSTSTAGAHAHNFSTNTAGAHAHNFTTGNAGSGGAHNNMPPALVANVIIKL